MATKIELYGTIGWDVASRAVVRQLSAIEADDDSDNDVVLHINSGGGFVDEAVAIFNRLRMHPGDVTVHIDGLAASAATVVAMAGDRIVMPDNATMMVHKPWALAIGDADDMRDMAGLLDTTEERMVAMYARRTGMAEDEVRDLLAEETWLTAEEAAEHGFVDEVTEGAEPVAQARAQAAQDYQSVAEDEERFDPYRKPPLWLVREDNVEATQQNTDAMQTPEQFQGRIAASITEQEKAKMAEEQPQNSAPESGASSESAPVVDEAAQERAKMEERKRVRAIMNLCAQHGVDDEFSEQLIDNDVDVVGAKAQILDWKGQQADPVACDIRVETSERENVVTAVERELMARSGLMSRQEAAEERRANPFASYSLYEMCAEFAEDRKGGRAQVVGRVFAHANRAYRGASADIGITHTGGDFTSVLENIANKSMLLGWEEAPETWDEWCNRGSLSDFKQASRADLNTFSDLDEVPEGDEFKSGTMGDRNVDIQLATYGKLFGITRQAVINDDMGAFSRIPRKMGRAAARKVGDLAYGILTDNDDFGDGTNLFAAGHSNTDTVDIDRAGVQALRVAMTTQTDPEGNTLNIQPSIIVCPDNLVLKATEITQAQLISLSSAGVTNVQAGSLRVVSDPRLDTADNTVFYLMADPSAYDTVEVAFLNGNDMPFLEQQDGWRVDGTEFKVRIDAAAVARDYRTMQQGTSGTAS